MDADRLLYTLRERGLTVTADGDKLLVLPRDLLTDADREQIRQHKPELLALLTMPSWLSPMDYGPLLATLPEELRDLFEERAAIREFDGNLPREQAEALALAEVLAEFRRAVA